MSFLSPRWDLLFQWMIELENSKSMVSKSPKKTPWSKTHLLNGGFPETSQSRSTSATNLTCNKICWIEVSPKMPPSIDAYIPCLGSCSSSSGFAVTSLVMDSMPWGWNLGIKDSDLDFTWVTVKKKTGSLTFHKKSWLFNDGIVIMSGWWFKV